jgi:hypothetical protein
MDGNIPVTIKSIFLGTFLQFGHEGEVTIDEVRAVFDQLLDLFLNI